ncbi:MAG: mannosyl-3-phosphoglycerate phosphatase, partial [Candidatus Desulfofervidaceae bacterium]|nr:mannosyl-3-phosphoglycerate phosphatase [Candidatus Desulfofervidaceae bacterium]
GLISYPFISENGGAIFIPRGSLNLTGFNYKFVNGYQTIELGAPYEFIKKCFKKIKKNLKLNITGFSEMTVEEIVSLTNLPLSQAKLAPKREYSEPFVYQDDPDKLSLLEAAISKFGLNLTKGGRFYTLMASNNKGKAVQIVIKLYQQTFPNKIIVSIGLGDSLNDVSMLLHVDKPVIVRREEGKFLRYEFKNAYLTQAVGPQGWAEAIFRILKGGG